MRQGYLPRPLLVARNLFCRNHRANNGAGRRPRCPFDIFTRDELDHPVGGRVAAGRFHPSSEVDLLAKDMTLGKSNQPLFWQSGTSA